MSVGFPSYPWLLFLGRPADALTPLFPDELNMQSAGMAAFPVAGSGELVLEIQHSLLTLQD